MGTVMWRGSTFDQWEHRGVITWGTCQKLDQTMPSGIGHRLSSVGHVGLVEYISYVGAHRSDTDQQLFSYLSVGLSGDDVVQHIHLALS